MSQLFDTGSKRILQILVAKSMRYRFPRLRSCARLAAAVLLTVVLGAAADPGDAARQGLALFRKGSFAEAHQVWREGALSGDAASALYLGVSFDAGLGVGQSDQEARTWYEKAANEGSAAAAFNVGVLYDAGIGMPRDLAQAADWYRRAAAQGFGRAEYNLAQLYETGAGVARSHAQAIALYRAAASHGIAAARVKLPQSGGIVAAAVRPSQDAALTQFNEAQRLLLGRTPGELAEAVRLFRLSADKGDALAAYDLGYCYERGIGVGRDLSQAVSWYRQAARDTRNNDLRNIASAGVGNLEQQIRKTQLQ